MHVDIDINVVTEEGGALRVVYDIPRLSAAMTTPSLNFMAITEVPVTMGDCVCWLGPLVCMYEWS